MFKAKKVVDLIIEEIKANLTCGFEYTVHDLYGKRIENLEDFFTKTNAIYVIYGGCRYETLTQFEIHGDISIIFVIIDQVIGTKHKDKYFLDDVRDFLTWRDFTELTTEYSTDDFQAFMPEDETLFIYDEKKGRAIWTITGTIGFDKSLL